MFFLINLHESDEFSSIFSYGSELVFAYLECKRSRFTNLNRWNLVGGTCLVVFETEREFSNVIIGVECQYTVIIPTFETKR